MRILQEKQCFGGRIPRTKKETQLKPPDMSCMFFFQQQKTHLKKTDIFTERFHVRLLEMRIFAPPRGQSWLEIPNDSPVSPIRVTCLSRIGGSSQLCNILKKTNAKAVPITSMGRTVHLPMHIYLENQRNSWIGTYTVRSSNGCPFGVSFQHQFVGSVCCSVWTQRLAGTFFSGESERTLERRNLKPTNAENIPDVFLTETNLTSLQSALIWSVSESESVYKKN